MTSPYPILSIVGILVVALTLAAGLIWLERRLLALWQDRYGPNRVGPFGLLQVVADMIKIFFKEDWIPPFADKAVFVLAPAMIVVTVLMSFAVLTDRAGHHRQRSEYRSAVRSGDVLARSLQRGARRVVLQQQVLAARRAAGRRADAELRSFHGAVADGRGPAGGLVQPVARLSKPNAISGSWCLSFSALSCF